MYFMKRSALDLIGETALIELSRLYPGPGKLVAKAEYLQPGGSIKDRAARSILLNARKAGALSPGQRVVEMTSGNMGAGLAIACNVLGHPLTLFMSAGNSPARARMMRDLGAEVILVAQRNGVPEQVTGDDIAAVEVAAVEHARDLDAYYVDQFSNRWGLAAHYEGTGPELYSQTGGSVHGFVAGIGTGATFVGTSAFLKERNPETVCVAVEPHGAEVLAGKAVTEPRHIMQGIGYGLVPPLWRPELADSVFAVSSERAAECKGLLARVEGLHVGYSSAANVAAAIELLRSGRLPPEAVVATVLCDTGLKYA